MRIVDMHVTPIALGDPPLLNAAGLHAPWCLRTVVELVMADGLTGIAEVPGSAAITAALEAARDVVVGRDPRNRHVLMAEIRERFGGSASEARGETPWDQRSAVQVASAIDVACFDVVGKATGVPVATLLGGIVRDRVPYAAYLFYKYEGAGGPLGAGLDPDARGWAAARQRAALDPEGIVAQAKAMVESFGFTSIKLKGGVFEPEQEVAAMFALRDAFGADYPLRLDPNALWTVDTSIRVGRQLEGVLEYLEDPTRGQENMAAVRCALSIPLATNMCTTSFEDFPSSVRLGAEDVVLTDHHFWGGLHAAMEMGTLCRVFGRGVSMHSNSHAGISLAAMTHLGAALPNLSYALDTHYPWQSDEIITGGRIVFDDGCVRLPDGPGLGVELDREALARAHEAFLTCGLTERNDEVEMQKRVAGWTFCAVRW